MKQVRKRFMSLLTAAALTCWTLPQLGMLTLCPALTAGAEEADNRCGSNLTWEFDQTTGTLTLSGTGAMESWHATSDVPWSQYATQIRTVVLPEGLTAIGTFAFFYCKELTEINFPDSLSEIGFDAFSYCQALKHISLPDSVTQISDYAFDECTSLESAVLPDGLQSLGYSVFSECSSLKTVHLPETLTKLSSNTFWACTALTSITLPEGLTQIGSYAFADSGLTELTIPESVTVFGSRAFADTPWLAARQAESPFVTERGILIDATACTGEVSIPRTVTEISDSAFSGCCEMTAVTIPDSVTKLGTGVFSACSALTSVTLPASMQEIPSYTFSNCTEMTSFTVPSSVTQIGRCAFSGCTSLAEITVFNPYCIIADNTDTLPAETVICSYPGALAERYAKQYERTFRALEGEPEVNYTYEIIPLLAPFNSYFFVKTNNPDPTSFRFADSDSVYSEDASIECMDYRYGDVQYESEDSLRVGGGYIFSGSGTDGGTLQLQISIPTNSYYQEWVDFGGTYTIPALYDTADYLIRTYATKDSFFENMDAVQTGFSSVCLYSGSYIRGSLSRSSDYWSVARAGHADQLYYIYSPYRRNNNVSLFATVIYPFRYDSLGFPGMMGLVSKRLNSESEYKWSQTSHAHIQVTYDGTTKTYGGQGHGEGQGLSADKLTRFFDFSEDDRADITLDSMRQLQRDYAKIEMDDDIPREDSVTWLKVADRVGACGEWAKIGGGLTHFYKADDSGTDGGDEWGVGYSIYWGGSLGYFKNVWLDGRYINQYQMWDAGETFADHPTADLVLRDVTVPDVTYTSSYIYNAETGYETLYDVTDVREMTATVRYRYSEEEGLWRAVSTSVHQPNTPMDALREMTEQGQIDAKYLDALELTAEEVAALGVDRNTDSAPERYYLYDGSAEPGTAYMRVSGDFNGDCEISIADAVLLARFLAEDSSLSYAELDIILIGEPDQDRDGLVTALDMAAILGKLKAFSMQA